MAGLAVGPQEPQQAAQIDRSVNLGKETMRAWFRSFMLQTKTAVPSCSQETVQ